MTRKDYIALAEALREAHDLKVAGSLNHSLSEARYEVWRQCVAEISDVLKADNSRFDRERFERAAGVVS